MAGTAMKIRWVLRHNPQNRLLPPKYYAAPVFAGRRDAGEMIRQIAGRSVLSAANWLAAGCSVELPEIGSLLLEFSSEGFDDPADFRPESLRGVRLRFYPSRQLMKAIKSQLNISLPE